eukprot:4048957-Prymnesium_polylepis.1
MGHVELPAAWAGAGCATASTSAIVPTAPAFPRTDAGGAASWWDALCGSGGGGILAAAVACPAAAAEPCAALDWPPPCLGFALAAAERAAASCLSLFAASAATRRAMARARSDALWP